MHILCMANSCRATKSLEQTDTHGIGYVWFEASWVLIGKNLLEIFVPNYGAIR